MAGQLRTPRPYRSRRSHVLVRHALSDWVDRVPNGQPRYSVVKQLSVAVLGAARSAGVQHGIIQNMRFNAGPRKAHELLRAGYVGRIFSTDVVFGYMVPQTVLNRPTWFYKLAEAGGGVVEDMMAHFFDLLRTLLGPIDAVYAATGIAWAE